VSHREVDGDQFFDDDRSTSVYELDGCQSTVAAILGWGRRLTRAQWRAIRKLCALIAHRPSVD
jgi:hypothetical protein